MHVLFVRNSAKDKGVVASETNARTIITSLNNAITETDIQVAYSGWTELADDSYWKEPFSTFYNKTFYLTDPVDLSSLIIIVNGEATSFDCGSGVAHLDYPGIKISGNILNMPEVQRRVILAHEFGHTLGLLHTFWGTKHNTGICAGTYGETKSSTDCALKNYQGRPQRRELSDNSVTVLGTSYTNGEYCGDFISDTEADPDRWSGVCPDKYWSNPSITDSVGDSYGPDINNVMSYGYKGDVFTTIQSKVMRQTAKEKWWCRVHARTITGADMLEEDDVATYDISTTAEESDEISRTWSITNNSGAASINSSTGVVTINGSGAGEETITWTTSCFKYKVNTDNIYITTTKTIGVNTAPDAPYVSQAWDVDNSVYLSTTLETGKDYGLLMYCSGYPSVSCTSADTDHQWVSSVNMDNSFYDFGLRGYVVNNEWCYFNLFDEGTYTFKARYRLASYGQYSNWKYKSLTFQGGMMMMMSPNPVMMSASTISLESTSSEPLDYEEGWEIWYLHCYCKI